MNGQIRVVSPALKQKSLMPQDILDILWRRKWWLIVPLVLGSLIGGVYSLTVPYMYRSSTLILIQPQAVSDRYVNVTVPKSLDERLRTISQQILSRQILTRVIKDHNLYKKTPTAAPSGSLVDRVQNKVKKLLASVGFTVAEPAPPAVTDEVTEEVIERMRKAIEIKVTGKEAFAVTYSGTDPTTVMRVTNALASLFIEGHLKDREFIAESTSEFLESQLKDAERDLAKQEKSLREFKEKFQGALPGQLDTSLRTLDRLQLEFQSINEAITKAEATLAEERKAALKAAEEERKAVQELAQLSNFTETVQKTEGPTSTPAPPPVPVLVPVPVVNQKLEALKLEYEKLTATFQDNYPEVARLKREIEELSRAEAKRIESAAQAKASSTPSTTPSPTPSVSPTRPAGPQSIESLGLYNRAPKGKNGSTADGKSAASKGTAPAITAESLPSPNAALEGELAGLKARRQSIMGKIQDLEKRVEATPGHEERLAELMRDYNISLKSYQTLLEKRLNAKIAENLEKKQKGEQFKILDSANLPSAPYKPQRILIAGAGGVVGSGLVGGVVVLLALLRPAFRRPEDVQEIAHLPVLATIPRYKLKQQGAEDLVVLQEADSYAAEQYRVLYTRIRDWGEATQQKVFAMTSALQGEGKTVTALNLAVVMAKDFGKRTLVLEGDFRRPSIPRYLKVKLEEGLVDILSNKNDIQASILHVANSLVPFADDNLSILPAVRKPVNFSSILSSQRMRDLFEMLKERYDYIILDAPPILPLSDMNIFEQVVDGIVMVVRSESTPQSALIKAIQMLSSDKMIGIVLNDMRQSLSTYARNSYEYQAYTSQKKKAARSAV